MLADCRKDFEQEKKSLQTRIRALDARIVELQKANSEDIMNAMYNSKKTAEEAAKLEREELRIHLEDIHKNEIARLKR